MEIYTNELSYVGEEKVRIRGYPELDELIKKIIIQEIDRIFSSLQQPCTMDQRLFQLMGIGSLTKEE